MNLQAAKPKTDKRKIALIPVLAGILLWNLTAGDDVKSVENIVENSEKALTEAEALIQQLRRNQERASQKNWPKFELDDVVKFDPFSLAGTLAERSGQQSTDELLAMTENAEQGSAADSDEQDPDATENPVRAVTIGRNGAAALVDSRIVRVGDELEDGIRIVAIERNAIVVEMVD